MIKWNLVFSFVLTVLIPLLYLFNINIAYKTPNSFNPPILLIYAGIFLGLLGALIWAISYINLGHSFGVLPKKQKRVKKGLYKYFNHPMYMGIYLTFLGISLANSSWQGLVFLNLVVLPVLFVRALFEDKKLN